MKEIGLKIRSLQLTEALAETGKQTMKRILSDEQSLFAHFRLCCAERGAHLVVLLGCPLLRRARNSPEVFPKRSVLNYSAFLLQRGDFCFYPREVECNRCLAAVKNSPSSIASNEEKKKIEFERLQVQLFHSFEEPLVSHQS